MLPDGINDRKKYNQLIERGVNLLREKELLTQDLDQLKAEVEEELGKTFSRQFKKYVKARFNGGTVQRKAEEDLELIAELDILEKLGRSNNE